MKTQVLILLLAGMMPCQADIFKCVVDGKARYQANPCKEEKHETALNIKTRDLAAQERAMDAQRAFNLQQLDKGIAEAEIRQRNARAMRDAAIAQQQAAQAEARLREAEAYQRSVESQQQRDEAWSKYLYKEAGMSPTFGR